jgi:hypothetical protein
VEATDRRWARVKIFRTVVNRLEYALEARGHALPEGPTEDFGENYGGDSGEAENEE